MLQLKSINYYRIHIECHFYSRIKEVTWHCVTLTSIILLPLEALLLPLTTKCEWGWCLLLKQAICPHSRVHSVAHFICPLTPGGYDLWDGMSRGLLSSCLHFGDHTHKYAKRHTHTSELHCLGTIITFSVSVWVEWIQNKHTRGEDGSVQSRCMWELKNVCMQRVISVLLPQPLGSLGAASWPILSFWSLSEATAAKGQTQNKQRAVDREVTVNIFFTLLKKMRYIYI